MNAVPVGVLLGRLAGSRVPDFLDTSLIFVHAQHASGKAHYIDYRLEHQAAWDNPTMEGLPNHDAYRKEPVRFGGEILPETYRVGDTGVVALGDVFSRLMRAAPREVASGNWRAVESSVIDWIAHEFEDVNHLVVNHHPANLLQERYVRGITDESLQRLTAQFGRDGAAVYLLLSTPATIEKRIALAGDSVERRFPFGIDVDREQKIAFSQQIYDMIPRRKAFYVVESTYPILMPWDDKLRTALERQPYSFSEPRTATPTEVLSDLERFEAFIEQPSQGPQSLEKQHCA